MPTMYFIVYLLHNLLHHKTIISAEMCCCERCLKIVFFIAKGKALISKVKAMTHDLKNHRVRMDNYNLSSLWIRPWLWVLAVSVKTLCSRAAGKDTYLLHGLCRQFITYRSLITFSISGYIQVTWSVDLSEECVVNVPWLLITVGKFGKL